ncbi:2-C-methyl-D-erythritol 4-phosphate cytidylyltransferase [Enorma burkinafasonensis]|uniref:2-C-methyl-D-erythritol 4-phosphate cytidylyltransferase n=1 Tax=Enorma burkinafasonensis TaxID=2590867 RepID=UPI00119FDF03|nr:2-C-methyl-D-erythritol 4-phosphate cytidylyltransferase [Enorma burkinafasonensis]
MAPAARGALGCGAGAAGARVCAVVVAGGSGQRFGNPGGKQLIDVAGRPLMSWCLEAFDRAAHVGHIVVVCPAGRRDEMRRRAVEPFGFATPVTFADAGATRQDSTDAGVEAVPAGFDIVAVHDGARPLITPEAIDHAIEVLLADPALDGVVCGQPAIDTLKVVGEDGIIEDTPPRSRFWTVQTPQIIRLDAMRRAHEAAGAAGFVGTDDSSLVERFGGRMRCVETARDNLKVTVPEDLLPVTAMLEARRGAR